MSSSSVIETARGGGDIVQPDTTHIRGSGGDVEDSWAAAGTRAATHGDNDIIKSIPSDGGKGGRRLLGDSRGSSSSSATYDSSREGGGRRAALTFRVNAAMAREEVRKYSTV